MLVLPNKTAHLGRPNLRINRILNHPDADAPGVFKLKFLKERRGGDRRRRKDRIIALTAHAPFQDLINLVGALRGTWHGRTAMCLCPVRADKSPNLALRQGDRGVLITCFAGYHRADVLRDLARVPVRTQYHSEDRPPAGTGSAERRWYEALSIDRTMAGRCLASRHLLPAPHDVRFHPR